MNSRKIVFMLALFMILPAAHASSIAITQAGADANTVMKSVSFTVTVSDLSGTGSVSLDLPTGFSTEENTTKTFGGSTTSVSWTTVIANQQLSAQTLSAIITTTGSPETVTTSSFDVILPPSIVTDVSPSSISDVSAGSSHSINLNIQNYGETTAKDVVVTISLPSGFSLSSGISTQTISTISGGEGGSGETVGISWSVTADSPSDSSITISVAPSNADSRTDTILITAEASATTTTVSGGGGSSGGSSSGSSTYIVDDEDFSEGYTRELIMYDQLRFTLENETHYVKVVNITATTVKINVTSETQTAVLSIGEEMRFELDADSYYDLSVKLNAIASGKANLTISKIHIATSEAPVLTTIAAETTVPGEASTTLPSGVPETTADYRPVLMLVLLAMIIIVGWFYFKSRKKSLFPKPEPVSEQKL